MGGHGGLNILPQKRWNVYNWDNREKVKRDEEAAAREEQLHLEQTRRVEADSRLESLRRSRGIATASVTSAPASEPVVAAADLGVEADSRLESLRRSRGIATASATAAPASEPVVAAADSGVEASEGDSGHINLFGNLSDFGFLGSDEHRESKKAKREEAAGSHKKEHKRRKEEKEKPKEAKVIAPEEEKYRLGYGLAGKGVNKPWYLAKPVSFEADDGKEVSRIEGKSKKKSIAELREERMARERTEKDRERKLLSLAGKKRFSR